MPNRTSAFLTVHFLQVGQSLLNLGYPVAFFAVLLLERVSWSVAGKVMVMVLALMIILV